LKVYEERELQSPGFIGRLLGRRPKGNALIEINNLLAANQNNIKDISIDKILEIAERYNFDISKHGYQFRCDLFKSYLTYCLVDKKIEDHEVSELEHLKQILFLNDADTQNLIGLESKKIYETEVLNAINDGELNTLKRENLKTLQSNLHIPESLAQNILNQKSREV
jgi:hypothetical protein